MSEKPQLVVPEGEPMGPALAPRPFAKGTADEQGHHHHVEEGQLDQIDPIPSGNDNLGPELVPGQPRRLLGVHQMIRPEAQTGCHPKDAVGHQAAPKAHRRGIPY